MKVISLTANRAALARRTRSLILLQRMAYNEQCARAESLARTMANAARVDRTWGADPYDDARGALPG